MLRTSHQTRLVLASSSPRRRALLRAAGLSFRCMTPGIDETPGPGEMPAAYARRAAREKADAVQVRLRASGTGMLRLVIGCDTVVALGRTILGKPADMTEAADMLHRLSGRSHEVLSGVCVLAMPARGVLRSRCRVVRTEVHFRRLSENEILRYASSGEPLDKAGAYAIQGGAAGMVRWIRGSYTNVVGLPMAEVLGMIERIQRIGERKEDGR